MAGQIDQELVLRVCRDRASARLELLPLLELPNNCLALALMERVEKGQVLMTNAMNRREE